MAVPLTKRLRLCLCILASAVLAFCVVGFRAHAFMEGALDAELEGVDIVVVGVIASLPQRNELGLRVPIDVESAVFLGKQVRLPPRLRVGWYGGVRAGQDGFELQRQAPDMRPGQRWQFTVRLKAPHGNANPDGFDYELWLWEQGIQATGYIRAGLRDPPPALLADTWTRPVERLRHQVRDAIQQRISDPRLSGVLAALAVGDQAAIDRADWDVFRATGVAHLMSISGLHVTMFAWAAALATGWAWRRCPRCCLKWSAPHAALAGGILLAAAYALFSGWGVPAQRTLWMLTVAGLLGLRGRQWPWPTTWLLTAAVVIAVDPWAMLQPGFWLSFVAVGMLFISGADRMRATASSTEGDDVLVPTNHRAFRALRRMLHEQAVMGLGLAPLSLLLFGQFSLVGLLANLVAIPLVTLVITPLALAGVLLPPLWDVGAWAVSALGLLLDFFSQWPFAAIHLPRAPWWMGGAAVFGSIALVMPMPPTLRALGLPLLMPVLLFQPVRPSHGNFEVLVPDIGQGNAVIIRTAEHVLLYDAGPRYGAESDAGHRVLVPLLQAGADRLDLLVLSHRDTDHTGGAVAVLTMQPQAHLLGALDPGNVLHAIRPVEPCRAGRHWTWDGVDFEVLHPARYEPAARPNVNSCVLRVGNGRVSALLAGDIERAQELVLAGSPATLRADLLLVPHHGSRTSSSDAFLNAVQPRFALVQAGYRNRFGHPAAEVVQRYRTHGVRLVETVRCGAARWYSSEPTEIECHRLLQRRYWHHQAP